MIKEVHLAAWDCSKIVEQEMYIWKYLAYPIWFIILMISYIGGHKNEQS